MTEYFTGPDGEPVGPELDALSDGERDSIRACLRLFAANADRMKYFVGRAEALGKSGADTVVTLIDVDDPTGHGRLFADLLMPGHDWQQYRDRGETPIARGLAAKGSFPDILAALGYDAAARQLVGSDELQVLVLHAETVQVMDARFPEVEGTE